MTKEKFEQAAELLRNLEDIQRKRSTLPAIYDSISEFEVHYRKKSETPNTCRIPEALIPEIFDFIHKRLKEMEEQTQRDFENL